MIKVFMHSPSHYEYLCGLGNALEKNPGLDVTYFSTEDYYYRDDINFVLVDLYPNPARFNSKVGKIFPHFISILAFIRRLISDRPEILHIQHFRHHILDWPILIIAKLMGIKTVVTVHNFLPHEAKTIDRPVYRLIYWLADALIAHTNHTANRLMRELNVSRDKITVIPHGNLDFQLDPKINNETAKRHLEIPDDITLVLSFGRVRKYKGLDLLVEAFKRIDDPTIMLLVAGSGSGSLAQYVNDDRRIVLHTEFIDPAEVKYYFSAADLIVLPYRKIDQSGVLSLALAAGRPVLGSRVGGIGEVIKDGDNGFLCEPDDLESLSGKLSEILVHRAELGRIGENGKKTADETFSWESIAARTAALYQAQIT